MSYLPSDNRSFFSTLKMKGVEDALARNEFKGRMKRDAMAWLEKERQRFNRRLMVFGLIAAGVSALCAIVAILVNTL